MLSMQLVKKSKNSQHWRTISVIRGKKLTKFGHPKITQKTAISTRRWWWRLEIIFITGMFFDSLRPINQKNDVFHLHSAEGTYSFQKIHALGALYCCNGRIFSQIFPCYSWKQQNQEEQEIFPKIEKCIEGEISGTLSIHTPEGIRWKNVENNMEEKKSAKKERTSVLGEIRAYLGGPQSQKVTFGNSC